jgi:hypothetical protein
MSGSLNISGSNISIGSVDDDATANKAWCAEASFDCFQFRSIAQMRRRGLMYT